MSWLFRGLFNEPKKVDEIIEEFEVLDSTEEDKEEENPMLIGVNCAMGRCSFYHMSKQFEGDSEQYAEFLSGYEKGLKFRSDVIGK